MSKQPVITTQYFDPISQDYFKENPGVLQDERLAEYESFAADLIGAIAEVARVNKPSGLTGVANRKTSIDEAKDWKRLNKVLAGRFDPKLSQTLYDGIIEGEITTKDLAKDLCEHFLSLPKAAAPRLEVLLENVKNGGSRAGKALGEVTAEGSILRQDLRQVLWSPEGKLTELRFRAAGYSRTRTDFSMSELRNAEFIPNHPGRFYIPVSVEQSDALKQRMSVLKDESGKNIFKVGNYNPALKRLSIEIDYPPERNSITGPINLAIRAVNALKAGQQATEHIKPIIRKSDLGVEHALGAVINAPTAFLPAIPLVANGVGFVAAGVHDTLGDIPFVGEAFHLIAKGGLALAEFGYKRGNFLVGTEIAQRYANEAANRLAYTTNREREIIQNSKLPIFRAATGVVLGIGVASACRGTEIICNAAGDALSYAAKSCLASAKKPIEDPIQYARKAGAYMGYGFFTALSWIPKAPGFIAKKCGDACSTMADRFEGKYGFGWIADVSKGMKEAADGARFSRGKGKSFATLDTRATTPALGEENNIFYQAKKALNNAKGLKFDQSSGIKGDPHVYAILGEIDYNDGNGVKKYRVLGSSDGKTITVKNCNKSDMKDNQIGKLPQSLLLTAAAEGAHIAAFKHILDTEMQSRAQEDVAGVSLKEVKDSFNAAQTKQEAAQDLLRQCGVVADFEPGKRLISSDGEFKLKQDNTQDGGFSFEKKGSSKSVDFESTAFLNFLQDAAQGKTSVENRLSGRVGKPRTTTKVDNSTSHSKETGGEGRQDW